MLEITSKRGPPLLISHLWYHGPGSRSLPTQCLLTEPMRLPQHAKVTVATPLVRHRDYRDVSNRHNPSTRQERKFRFVQFNRNRDAQGWRINTTLISVGSKTTTCTQTALQVHVKAHPNTRKPTAQWQGQAAQQAKDAKQCMMQRAHMPNSSTRTLSSTPCCATSKCLTKATPRQRCDDL